MAECYTDDPEGLEACLTDCKAFLPEREDRYEECEERCYLMFCIDEVGGGRDG